jgi:hypothetical protein
MSIGTYGEPNAIRNAIDYAKFYSRSHDAVIRVYDEAGNAIETHEHAGDFKECKRHLGREQRTIRHTTFQCEIEHRRRLDASVLIMQTSGRA